MLRLAYALGIAYVGLCAVAIARRPTEEPPSMPSGPRAAAPPVSWFAAIRPRCNAVEIEVSLRGNPPPAGEEGYLAGCYALAGKIEEAKRVIDALPSGGRPRAADILFEIVHPVADAGDDRSAGPMMRLVLEYKSDNYMAVYHAGMSEYAMKEFALAKKHLKQFLELYRADDGWTSNARETLARPEMQ